MDAVLRGAAIYLFLILVFRLAGRRTLAELTTFDFVLLLIISESTQNAMVGDDFSLTNAAILICTLVGLDVGLGVLKRRLPTLEKALDGIPIVIVENGRALTWRMKKSHITPNDLNEALRAEGIVRIEDVRFAVLEVGGAITVIPKQDIER